MFFENICSLLVNILRQQSFLQKEDTMDDPKNKELIDQRDQEIIYSRSVKAGKRIYYLDVKRSRKDELFIAITESKKKVSGTTENPQVEFEKHKIFLYKEDFENFIQGLQATLKYIKENEFLYSSTDDKLSSRDLLSTLKLKNNKPQ